MSTPTTFPVPATHYATPAARIPVAGSLVTQNVSTSIHNAISAVVILYIVLLFANTCTHTHTHTRTHLYVRVCKSLDLSAAATSSLTGGELHTSVCVCLASSSGIILAKIHIHRCDCCCSHNVSTHVQLRHLFFLGGWGALNIQSSWKKNFNSLAFWDNFRLQFFLSLFYSIYLGPEIINLEETPYSFFGAEAEASAILFFTSCVDVEARK